MTDAPFWETKTAEEMTQSEWESLCDNCAKCCLFKLRDEDTDELLQTNVVCRLMDAETCQCTRYMERSVLVPECQTLTPKMVKEFDWLPMTCAYRLLAEGKPIPEWHPLITGDPNSVFAAGHSVKGRCINEDDADELQNHLIELL